MSARAMRRTTRVYRDVYYSSDRAAIARALVGAADYINCRPMQSKLIKIKPVIDGRARVGSPGPIAISLVSVRDARACLVKFRVSAGSHIPT